jgi:hypothetical protein
VSDCIGFGPIASCVNPEAEPFNRTPGFKAVEKGARLPRPLLDSSTVTDIRMNTRVISAQRTAAATPVGGLAPGQPGADASALPGSSFSKNSHCHRRAPGRATPGSARSGGRLRRWLVHSVYGALELALACTPLLGAAVALDIDGDGQVEASTDGRRRTASNVM